ncbi:MAG: LuxR C-terminal-related transcriptional regulator [Candidatus Zixiibacteriota bacterium]
MIFNKVERDGRTVGMLRNSEATLRSILSAAPLGICLIHNRRINWASEQLHTIVGYEKDELIGLGERILYDTHEEYLRIGEDDYLIARDENDSGTETTWRHKNGKMLHIILKAALINPHNTAAGIVLTALDNSKQKETEKALEALDRKLEHKQYELEKKTIALNEVFEHLEEQRDIVRTQVADIVDGILSPALKKLRLPDGTINAYYYELLTRGLGELVYATGDPLSQYVKLSPREMEISSLIRHGRSSKEIADELYISVGTVKRHRETIRKKLGINKKDVNLSMYLRNL